MAAAAIICKIGAPGSWLCLPGPGIRRGERQSVGRNLCQRGVGADTQNRARSQLDKDTGKGLGRRACPCQPAHCPGPVARLSLGDPHQQPGLQKELHFNRSKLSCRDVLVPGKLQEVDSSVLVSWATCLIRALSSSPNSPPKSHRRHLSSACEVSGRVHSTSDLLAGSCRLTAALWGKRGYYPHPQTRKLRHRGVW